MAITITVEAEEDEGADLGGKTMTSPRGIETLPSISSLIGKCWRRSTSIG